MSTVAFQWLFTTEYPPSLKSIPPDLNVGPDKIFDLQALGEAQHIVARDPNILPGLAPTNCTTMKQVVDFVRERHKAQGRDMFKAPNIGLRDDWFTDAVFGQQTLTGTNPAVITRASPRWIEMFKAAAHSHEAKELLTHDAHNFFVVDYSYIHNAMKIPEHIGLPPRKDDAARPTAYGGASVTLFRFEPEGRMHPFAIILDYQVHGIGPHECVFAFNRRLTSSAPGDEATDWPWRYAKTVTQVANWLGHEVGVHLVDTHLVEEVCLIAAHIAFEPNQDHLVFQLIKPHRDITFSVNALARASLVPNIVVPTAGFPKETVSAFLNHAYANFDWIGSYAPNNLRARGFPIEELQNHRYRNCAWARGVAEMWKIVHKFVSTVLKSQYPHGDKDVAADRLIDALCAQMHEGRLQSFPKSIKKFDELVDAVTNIIHIATTQHTSINYLQQYYMSFVPNLPGALYTPLPKTAADLAKVTEQGLLDALPINFEKHRFEWLMMGQVPYLLSFNPPMDKSLFHFAVDASTSTTSPAQIRAAAGVLKSDLEHFRVTVRKFSDERDDKTTPYLVLDTEMTTSSIIL